jgi:hypothetical protein
VRSDEPRPCDSESEAELECHQSQWQWTGYTQATIIIESCTLSTVISIGRGARRGLSERHHSISCRRNGPGPLLGVMVTVTVLVTVGVVRARGTGPGPGTVTMPLIFAMHYKLPLMKRYLLPVQVLACSRLRVKCAPH